MNARTIIAATAILALSACATAGEREVPGCRQGPCTPIGVPIETGPLAITPTEVVEDSRCPIEADCVWEGRVRLIVQVEHDGMSEPVELILGEPIAIGSGMLTFSEVAPDMSTQLSPLQPEDYQFGFTYAPHIMEDLPPDAL